MITSIKAKLNTIDKWQAAVFFSFLALIAMAPQMGAVAQTFNESLCAAIGYITGPTGKALATIAIIIVALMAMLGRLQWMTVIIIIVGIAGLFGAPEIVNVVFGENPC